MKKKRKKYLLENHHGNKLNEQGIFLLYLQKEDLPERKRTKREKRKKRNRLTKEKGGKRRKGKKEKRKNRTFCTKIDPHG